MSNIVRLVVWTPAAVKDGGYDPLENWILCFLFLIPNQISKL